jgi:two-component system, chemotaxis family, protein-glutamate methylesterase/glutaminase
MTSRHLVVIGASAGGIETLRELVGRLPSNFPAPIAIVLHTSPQSPGVLPGILTRAGHLTAQNARNGERLRGGHIYVAPPDYHLLVEPGRLRLTKGPRENRFRPAIDPLFRSAAQVYGPLAIGVVLTGNLDDGVAGLWTVKQLGGIAIAQDPAEALYPSMPENAIRHVPVDHVARVAAIGPLLVDLITAPTIEPEPPGAVPPLVDLEVRIARDEDPIKAGVQDMGEPSTFACPECHGVLLQVKEGERVRFRCHTGHAFSPESLLAEISDGIENALWNAIRSMQEGALLLRTMGQHIDQRHVRGGGAALVARGEQLLRQADTLREMATSAPEGDTASVTSAPSPACE